MASKVDVWNLSLSMLGSSQTIQSPNDPSEPAGSCNRHYDTARQWVLESAPWDSATKMPAMSLVLDQNTLPTNQIIYPGWRYVYQRPTDCLRFLWVTTQYGLRVNPFLAFWWRAGAMDCSAGSWGPFRPPYREVVDQTNQANPNNSINILTDQDSAYGVYVTDLQNVNLWSQRLKIAVAAKLATFIAGPISANAALAKEAEDRSRASISEALQLAFNERVEDPYPDSPAITARN